jgi:aspartyl-tRNA(Asn)/glutamyl-tRNA(Gln) amidotransferase subunit A
LLTPTTPTAAFKIAGLYGDSVLMQYADQLTVPGNHAGIPGISIPAGFDDEGLPIGIQFLANDFREDILFRAARAYELATETEAWRMKKPALVG